MKRRMEKGFTLVELMIVVAIIAILAAVAIPQMGAQIKKAKDAKAIAVMGAIRSNLSASVADLEGYYPTGETAVNLWKAGGEKLTAYDSASPSGDITSQTGGLDSKSAGLVENTGKAIADKAQGYIKAGKSEKNGSVDTKAEFEYKVTTTSGSIEFTPEAGNDTKGRAWASY